MEWTEETISRLRSLWQEGHSTAEIGRRLSITKNAVVGKAHRLILPARPSPIRKNTAEPGSQPARREQAQVARLIPRAGKPERIAHPAHVAGAVATVTALRAPPPIAPPTRVEVSADRAAPPAQEAELPVPRVGQTAQRRRGQTCCWPLGDPGTKQFRFCGGEPIPGKPYCTAHAQLAYVKLRDRRDTVA